MGNAIRAMLESLGDTGMVDTYDRDEAVEIFRAARRWRGWEVTGYSVMDFSDRLYVIEAKAPSCDGGCGGRTSSPTGMCYQCQCEAHAEGWYDHDTGYVRM